MRAPVPFCWTIFLASVWISSRRSVSGSTNTISEFWREGQHRMSAIRRRENVALPAPTSAIFGIAGQIIMRADGDTTERRAIDLGRGNLGGAHGGLEPGVACAVSGARAVSGG